ncbi:type I-D CRISPR-associated endonuclease Cas1 [Tychonema sp. LEGE 07199]|uniref:type I-D CRISPR-associated endonuclease Cas1d n=1 Tax=unclassified Tychonema TaxID=2642144 RepID=UPI001881700F|nr:MULTISPECIES: type I-D CRISPR-associated endonuclease Cas1d [unclassified Tychonema]MBE9123249.1 type I-D CRISPR-associated endonuclease Cas1 [Tychonema sp. LEGE 07199]MBE9132769.1 type I-D CRISPR-associated endonuclease Cas1 [Tychonema sp. LEGE 07196]
MGTLYINQDDAFIGKVDERIVIKCNNKTLQEVPLIHLEAIVILGRATVSPAAIAELLKHKISLTFISEIGEYLGTLEPELTKNIFVRDAQWKAAGETPQAIHAVRGFIRGKLKNYRYSLYKTQGHYSELNLQPAMTVIQNVINKLNKVDNINSLRGLEGAGSAAYFGVFNQLIRAEGFVFKPRHRPAIDSVNSLMNFGYTLLRRDVQSAINIVGFDPYLGYLHVQRYGRVGLAFDLMEEFRALVVDSVILNAINNRILTPNDFTVEPLSNVVRLSESGRKEFLKLYEKKKQSEFKHPVVGRKCTYREAFEIQARLLAKYLMGQIDQYPPLVLK